MEVQIAASSDDAYEFPESTGVVNITVTSDAVQAHVNANARAWMGLRWTSGAFPVMGDIITVCYIKFLVWTSAGDGDDPRMYLHFQLSAAPLTFTTAAFNVTSRSRTVASVSWVAANIGIGWKDSPSLVVPMQEVIDSYSPTAIVAIGRPYTDAIAYFYARSYDYGAASSSILHLEWNAPGGTKGKSANMGAKLIAGRMI